MENLINLISSLSNANSHNQKNEPQIPKEILDQYPYGEFPIRYTKVGQDTIRRNSENRFSYNTPPQEEKPLENNQSSLDLKSMLPLIQTLSNKKNSPKDLFKVFSQLLFKNNPELSKLINLFSSNTTHNENIKSQEINNTTYFPDTNKVNISSLKKVEK